MCIRNGHLPYAEVSRNGREVFSESQREDVPPVVPARQFSFGDSPCSQQRREEDDNRDDVEQRDRDGIRESVEDYLVNNVAPGAHRVPKHTQDNYPNPFPDRGPRHRSHLSARSDESPPVCLVLPGLSKLRQTVNE